MSYLVEISWQSEVVVHIKIVHFYHDRDRNKLVLNDPIRWFQDYKIN